MIKSKNKSWLVVIFLFLLVVGAVILRKQYGTKDTSVSINETKQQYVLSVGFPKARTESVHKFLKERLMLTDMPDLNDVEIKQYHTPDRSMNFYVKSRQGYLKIAMDKQKNSDAALERLKRTSEELGLFLVDNTSKAMSY